MLYFSYGSNMSLNRIKERVPSVKVIGVGEVSGHELKFHKISKKDGSAKCDIYQNDEVSSKVFGVIFELDEKEKIVLDRKEGLGYGYEQKEVEISTLDGEKIKAFTYYATTIDDKIKPYTWYKEHVLRGAKENNLPKDYIAKIEKIKAIEDPNTDRNENEMKIYR